MNFAIRQATAADAEAISGLVLGVAHYVVADPLSQRVGPFMAGLAPTAYAERIGSPCYCHFVAEDPASLCGVIALRDDSHLFHLFVRADAHGRGSARAVWQHAQALSGHSAFTVNASLLAVPIYERLGFVANAPPQTADGLVFVPMRYAPDS